MSLIRATDVTITIINPSTGKETTFPRGIVLATALAFASPIVQAEAAAAARAEEEEYRRRLMGAASPANQYLYSLLGTHTKFNRGKFTALSGGHTRHAMRYWKLARYRQEMRNR